MIRTETIPAATTYNLIGLSAEEVALIFTYAMNTGGSGPDGAGSLLHRGIQPLMNENPELSKLYRSYCDQLGGAIYFYKKKSA